MDKIKLAKGDNVKIVGNREGELRHSFNCYIGEIGVVNYKYFDGDYAVTVPDGTKILVEPHEIEPVESSEVAELRAENEKLKKRLDFYIRREERLTDYVYQIDEMRHQVQKHNTQLEIEIDDLKTTIREVLELRDYLLDLYLARSQTIKQLEEIING